jgi:hypothetical protein
VRLWPNVSEWVMSLQRSCNIHVEPAVERITKSEVQPR